MVPLGAERALIVGEDHECHGSIDRADCEEVQFVATLSRNKVVLRALHLSRPAVRRGRLGCGLAGGSRRLIAVTLIDEVEEGHRRYRDNEHKQRY